MLALWSLRGFDGGTADELVIEPVPPDQLAAVASQARTMEVLPHITPALEATPGFAGLYFDPHDLGLLIVRFAGDPGPVAAILAGSGITGYEVRPARFTHAELQAVQTMLEAEHESWRARGLLLVGFGVDPVRNVVGVTVEKSSAPAAIALINEMYGERVDVALGEPYIALDGQAAGETPESGAR